MATIWACEKPEPERVFIFSVEFEDASLILLSVRYGDRHRASETKLADALLRILNGDLARRLDVMSENFAWCGLVLD